MKLVWNFAKEPPTLRGALKVLGVMTVLQVILIGALAWMALRPHPVVVVPGVPQTAVAVPETIPLGAARKFALLYLTYFDEYTPATIEERSTWVLRHVAPENVEEATRTLTERANYIARSREASQLVLPLPEACAARAVGRGQVDVEAVATKRTYIAGSMKEERKLRYRLTLRSAAPTDDDPYGFVIVRQAIEPVAILSEVPDDRR